MDAADPLSGLVPGEILEYDINALRDYLAASAPVSLTDAAWALQSDTFSCLGDGDGRRGALFAMVATLRYEYADAMLKAREATQGRGGEPA